MSTALQITLSPEVAELVVREAARQGTSPEVVANETLRQHYAPAAEAEDDADSASPPAGTLLDRVAKHVGVIDTGGANLSADTSKKYADSLVEEHRRKQAP